MENGTFAKCTGKNPKEAQLKVKIADTALKLSLAAVYSDADCTTELTAPTFRNTELGNLEVTKTVTGSYTAGETDTYPFTVKKGEKYVTAERVGTATAYTYNGLSDTDPEYVIRDGETIRFEKLPAGEYIYKIEAVSSTGEKSKFNFKFLNLSVHFNISR